MKKPAIGFGEHYRTDGKGHFRKSDSLSYRTRLDYPFYVGRAFTANHAKPVWKRQQRKGVWPKEVKEC